MASIGDFITVNGRTYRFTSIGTDDAFVPWSPWGENYQNTSLALAKLDVPIDGSIDERIITLQDTTADKVYIYILKSAGYGASFDLSFDLSLDPDNPAVTTDEMDGILATKDIDTLSGMSSNSAAVEAAVAGVSANTTILTGINNAALTSALSNSHAPNTDTGTTQPSFVLDSDGPFPITLDGSTLTASATLDLEEINDNLNLADAFMPIREQTIAQVLGLSSDGDTFIVTDIGGASTPFLLTFDATNFIWLSGVYLMQDGGTPIVASPVAGTVYVYEESFWECLDATNEIFKITGRLPVTAHTASTVQLTTNEMVGGQVHSNDAAPGTVTLTSATETEGMLVTLVKNDASTFIFEDSGNNTVVTNSAGGTSASIELAFVGGSWITFCDNGAWA